VVWFLFLDGHGGGRDKRPWRERLSHGPALRAMALPEQVRQLRAGSIAIAGLALCCLVAALLSRGGTAGSPLQRPDDLLWGGWLGGWWVDRAARAPGESAAPDATRRAPPGAPGTAGQSLAARLRSTGSKLTQATLALREDASRIDLARARLGARGKAARAQQLQGDSAPPTAATLENKQVDTERTDRGSGSTHFLDRQDVDCKGSPIAGFQMQTTDEMRKISYKIQCGTGATLDVSEVSIAAACGCFVVGRIAGVSHTAHPLGLTGCAPDDRTSKALLKTTVGVAISSSWTD